MRVSTGLCGRTAQYGVEVPHECNGGEEVLAGRRRRLKALSVESRTTALSFFVFAASRSHGARTNAAGGCWLNPCRCGFTAFECIEEQGVVIILFARSLLDPR